ncbi:MAG TPA: DUF1877 family protein [Nostocaceae cyanobacterium]|nr:DUF1877 family protein [Nostocaceae cyanobacterium]
MGISGRLKQISIQTLEIFKQDPSLVKSLFDAEYLPESASWQRKIYLTGETAEILQQEARKAFGNLPNSSQQTQNYDWKALQQQFIAEWETPELDLEKLYPELTFLLAGYVPGYISSQWTIPELRTLANSQNQQDFLSFLVIENSQWDGLPLVNAIGAGTEIGYSTSFGAVRYLETEEIRQIVDGLILLSESGFQERYTRESEKAQPLSFIDWSEDEMIDWLIEYYNEIQAYYEDALSQQKAILLYLT